MKLLPPQSLFLLLPLAAWGSLHAADGVEVAAAGDGRQVAAEIAADLDKLIGDYSAVFERKDARIAGTWLGHAHAAATKLSEEEGEDLELVNEFHNNLDEFIRAMTGDADSHGGASPSGTDSKTMLKVAFQAKKKANRDPGLMEVGLVELEDQTRAGDAVRYGLLMIDKMKFTLEHRGVQQITGDGRKQTNEIVGVHLETLRVALSAMVSSDGERAVQADDAGKPLADQLANVTNAIQEVRASLPRLKLTLPWADRRIALVTKDLDRLEKNIAKPKAMRERPN